MTMIEEQTEGEMKVLNGEKHIPSTREKKKRIHITEYGKKNLSIANSLNFSEEILITTQKAKGSDGNH
jgi:hypothetical protein